MTILVAHHQRKLAAEDWIDTLSGTFGLAGAADALVGIFGSRGEPEAPAKLTGRDVEEAEFGLRFAADTGTWTLAAGLLPGLSPERREIVRWLQQHGPSTPATVATALGKNGATTRRLLARLLASGHVTVNIDHQYAAFTPFTPVHGGVHAENADSEISVHGVHDFSTRPRARGCPHCGNRAYSEEPDGRRRCTGPDSCGTVYGDVDQDDDPTLWTPPFGPNPDDRPTQTRVHPSRRG